MSHRQMMATDCFLLGGRMFAFFPPDDSAAFQLPPVERERLLALPAAGPFTMSRGVFGTSVRAPLAALEGGALVAFARAACEYLPAQGPAKQAKKKRLRPLDKHA